jgi:acyl carrier protein
MPETKVLNTRTLVTIIGANISIQSYYDQGIVNNNILEGFISDSVKTVEGVDFIEGQLGIRMNDQYPSGIDVTIDSEGNLIIVGDSVEKYSLDASGNLIYTE